MMASRRGRQTRSQNVPQRLSCGCRRKINQQMQCCKATTGTAPATLTDESACPVEIASRIGESSVPPGEHLANHKQRNHGTRSEGSHQASAKKPASTRVLVLASSIRPLQMHPPTDAP